MKTGTVGKRAVLQNRSFILSICTIYREITRRLSSNWRLFIANSSSRIVPGCCALCHEQSGSQLDLCQFCVADLPFNPFCCHSCAMPLADGASGRRCGRCSAMPPPVRVVMSVCLYRYPADIMVHRLKYGAELKWGRIMGLLMASQARMFYAERQLDLQAAVDLIIPIPLSDHRHRQRGYNQSQEIAMAISREISIPLNKQMLVRSKHSQAQAGLTAAERRRNVYKAFTASGVSGLRLVLIDDVITTGTTAFDAASALLSAGAAAVDVWVFARTP